MQVTQNSSVWELKTFKCSSPCSGSDLCANMPLEIHGRLKKQLDILIITEFAGSKEAKEKQYLVGKFGTPFRNIMKHLEAQYEFSWGIAGLYKGISNPTEIKANLKLINTCAKQILRKEIEYCNPKVIILLGDITYQYFHNSKLPYGMFVEDGRMEKISIFGTQREAMFSIHPNWHASQSDSCAMGLLYENIRKAVSFAVNKTDWRIRDSFESNLITTIPQLKSTLKELKNTPAICCADTEDRNLNRVYDNEILSIQLSVDGKVGHVIPFDHFDSPFKNNLGKVKEILSDFFFEKTKIQGYLWVNPKYDYHQLFRTLKRFSLNAPNIDLSFGGYSLEENWTRVFGFPKQKGPFSLFTMAYKSNFNFYVKTDSKDKRTILSHLPMKEWLEYGAADVVAPWQIYQKQIEIAKETKYDKDFLFLNELFHNHMNRATTYVEHCGLPINFKTVTEFTKPSSQLNKGIEEILNEFYKSPNVLKANEILSQEELGVSAKGLFSTAKIWNPSKNLHRDLLFFNVMELEPIENDDDDSASTGKEFQEFYKGIPEVDLLAEFNALSKLKTGFVNPLYKWMRPNSPEARVDFYKDSRSRGSFLTDAVTGRLKCIAPNGQQRPSRGKYAKALLSMYEPKKGRVIIKLDYSTFEVMGLGFISEDEAMIESFIAMHKLKKQFRKDPTCFAKEGYQIANGILDAYKKELITKKKELLSYIDTLDSKKRKSAQKELKEEIAKYKQDVIDLKLRYKNDPVSFSKAYLEFSTDFHRRSASLFNKVDIAQVTPSQRQGAKNLVFGCFTSDTIVSTSTGGYRIGEIKDKPIVVSRNGKLRQSGGVISQGIKPVVQVMTRQSMLKGTSGHEVLTVTNTCKIKKKALMDLEVGDSLVYQMGSFGNHIPVIGDSVLTVEDTEALGLFTADGCSGVYDRQNYRVHHCSEALEEVRKVRKFVYKFCGIKPKITRYKNLADPLGMPRKSPAKWVYMFQINNKELYFNLKSFNLLGKQDIRRVPDQIIKAKKEYVSSYLSGYFDGDGGIRKTTKGYKQIFLSSINPELLYDVAYLLNLFNISSGVYKASTGYELVITSSASICKFYEVIGFKTEKKREVLKEYINHISSFSQLPKDKYNLPFSFTSLRKHYCKKAGVNTFRSRKVDKDGIQIMPLGTLQHLLNTIDNYEESFKTLSMSKEWETLKMLSREDCRITVVVEEGKDIGEQEVFDVINVEEEHLWCANGVVVSNSIYGRSIESIAKVLGIDLELAKEYYEAFMRAMPDAVKWLEQMKIIGRENYCVNSPLGRRRRLWGHFYDNKSIKSKMDRYAMNTIIQGVCSDLNLIGVSLLIDFIESHGKAKYQCDEKDAWYLTMLIHDSTEMEVPLEDAYYVLSTFETIFTSLLRKYVKEVFDFEIRVPISVDFTVGTNYGNTKDWNGSKIHAKELQKWLIKELETRDNTRYKGFFKRAVNNRFFETHGKDKVKEIVKSAILRDKKVANRIKTRK